MTDNARTVREALETFTAGYAEESDYQVCTGCGSRSPVCKSGCPVQDALDALTALETELATAKDREAELTKALAEVQADLERARGTRAAQDVLAERRRQIEAEGWTPEHDDQHGTGELARAAACYAIPMTTTEALEVFRLTWPWDLRWWKHADRRRNLVKAGALILAEIERLDRAAMAPEQKGERAMSGHKTEEEAIAAAKAAVYGFTDFNGQNCENPCAGWDGDSPRCECGNRRVDWATGRNDDGTFYAYAEAY